MDLDRAVSREPCFEHDVAVRTAVGNFLRAITASRPSRVVVNDEDLAYGVARLEATAGEIRLTRLRVSDASPVPASRDEFFKPPVPSFAFVSGFAHDQRSDSTSSGSGGDCFVPFTNTEIPSRRSARLNLLRNGYSGDP